MNDRRPPTFAADEASRRLLPPDKHLAHNLREDRVGGRLNDRVSFTFSASARASMAELWPTAA